MSAPERSLASAGRAGPTAGPASTTPTQLLLWASVALLWIAARAYLAWRLAGTDPSAVTASDSGGYLRAARALLADGRLWTAPGSGVANLQRTPGYPLVLAGMLALRDDLRWVVAAQSVLAGALAPATYLLARRLVSVRSALVAAAIVALDPLLVVAGGTVLTEALSAATLLAVVGIAWSVPTPVDAPPTDAPAGATRWAMTPRAAARLAALGLALAVATLVRPTTYYFAPILLLLVGLHLRGAGVRRAALGIVVAAIPVVLVVGGWQARNHVEAGTWRLTTIDAVNLYAYRAAGVVAEVEGIPFAEAQRRLGAAKGTCPPWWDGPGCPADEVRGEFFGRMGAEGVRILLAHPVVTLRQTITGAGRVLFGPGLRTVTDFLGALPATALTRIALALWAVPVSALALAAVPLVVRHDHPAARRRWWFVAALVGYVIAVSSGIEGYARYRTPVVPLLALLVAGGLDALAARRGPTGGSGRSARPRVPSARTERRAAP